MGAFKEARHYTLQMLELVEEGVVDKDQLIQSLLMYLSEQDVEDFMRQYEYDEIASEF